MIATYDLVAIGNALVDVVAPADESFLLAENLPKGAMSLIDEARAHDLYGKMGQAVEASGGTAANTSAGLASLGGKATFIGKVAADPLGEVFTHDIRAIGVDFATPPLRAGPATGRCLINVTPDAERTMCTYLGAAVELSASDVAAEAIEAAQILYLEGYLFDPEEARRAFAKAAGLARGAGRTIALSLSDAFVVERHRQALLGFVQSQVDVLFANEAEVTALFPGADIEAALAHLAGLVGMAAVTFGARGSLVLAGEARIPIAAGGVEKVVDTTGAGDQYAAGFLYGLAQGRPLEDCGALGSMAAAEVISHYGPRPQTSLRDLAASRGF
ncbi:MAG: adenosine kinase [Caulobacteraceae bacterium]